MRGAHSCPTPNYLSLRTVGRGVLNVGIDSNHQINDRFLLESFSLPAVKCQDVTMLVSTPRAAARCSYCNPPSRFSLKALPNGVIEILVNRSFQHNLHGCTRDKQDSQRTWTPSFASASKACSLRVGCCWLIFCAFTALCHAGNNRLTLSANGWRFDQQFQQPLHFRAPSIYMSSINMHNPILKKKNNTTHVCPQPIRTSYIPYGSS